MKPGPGGTFVPVKDVQQAVEVRLGDRVSRSCRVLALLATATAIQPALAQRQAFTPRPSGSERQISVHATGQLEYNDNVVLNDPRITSGARGDVIASPSLDLSIVLPRATGQLYLAGTVGYRFYRRYTNFNRENISLTGGGDQRIASCVVHGEVGYQRHLTDLSSVLVQDTAPALNNTEEARAYSADIGCGSAYGLRPALAYSRNEVRNSLAQRKFADSDTNTVTAQLGLTSPALGTVSVFGRMSDSSYIHRTVPGVSGRDGMKSYAAGVQLERAVSSRLNFRGSVNYSKVDPKLASTPGFSGIGFDLSAVYSGDQYGVQLLASRNPQPSTLLFVGYEIVTTVSATATRKLSDRTQLSLQATKTWRELASSRLFTLAPTTGNDNTLTLFGTVNFRPNPRLNFSLGAGYNKRTSNIGLYQYRSKRINLTTSLSL